VLLLNLISGFILFVFLVFKCPVKTGFVKPKVELQGAVVVTLIWEKLTEFWD